MKETLFKHGEMNKTSPSLSQDFPVRFYILFLSSIAKQTACERENAKCMTNNRQNQLIKRQNGAIQILAILPYYIFFM